MRKAHKPTQKTKKEVIACRADGLNLDDTAAWIGVAKNTLLKHYDKELKEGKRQLVRQLMGNMKRQSDEGCFRSGKFLLAVNGYIEPKEIEADVSKDSPYTINLNLSGIDKPNGA